MSKGTASQGLHGRSSSHIICRRCGSRSRHKTTGICSSCGFGKTAKVRNYKFLKDKK